MFNVEIYPDLKENNAIKFEKNEDGTIKYTIKQFNALTGEAMPDFTESFTLEQLEETNTKLEDEVMRLLKVKVILKDLKAELIGI